MTMKNPDPTARLLEKLMAKLLIGHSFTRAESRSFFHLLFTGRVPFQKAKTFLLLFAKKGETAEELLGCLQALQALEKPIGPRIPGLMDTCGTGGDGSQTLNISTLTAIVIAGAGGKIAKHGNRAISSKSGSSDLMESLGIPLNSTPGQIIRSIRRLGLGYFHAPFHHPVFAKMQSLRQSLKRRTILNLLGPLVNPMRLDYQLVGVSYKHLVPLYAKVLSKLGRKAALVCHSFDGMDEISAAVPTTAAWVTPNRIRRAVIRPAALGLQKATANDLKVDSVKQSCEIAKKILSGSEKGPARDIVILNAAYGLVLCRKAKNIQEGIRFAIHSIDSGKATRVLQKLKQVR